RRVLSIADDFCVSLRSSFIVTDRVLIDIDDVYLSFVGVGGVLVVARFPSTTLFRSSARIKYDSPAIVVKGRRRPDCHVAGERHGTARADKCTSVYVKHKIEV